jgi:type IV secretion system protein VirB2
MRKFLPLLVCVAVCLAASSVFASGGISDFEAPAQQVVSTLTGRWARYFAIICMAITGITFIWKREELSGGFKMLLGLVFGLSFIAFASSIVDKLFDFSGAVL